MPGAPPGHNRAANEAMIDKVIRDATPEQKQALEDALKRLMDKKKDVNGKD